MYFLLRQRDNLLSWGVYFYILRYYWIMNIAEYQKRVDGAINYLMQELGGLQLGRATPGLLDNVTVYASYGTMKVNQVGHVSVLDNQTLKVECWDKAELKNVEKAIYDAALGLTPQNE